MKTINKISAFVGKNLIIFVLGVIALAFIFPTTLAKVTPQVTNLLSGVMFCMGLTLDISNFQKAFKSPRAIILGITLQFTIMPVLAWAIARAFNLEPGLMVGFVLLGAAPTGTASNVMTFIAEGDVALCVTMTAIATLLASVFTPALTLLLAGQYVEVSFMTMFWSVIKVVAIPIVSGLILHYIFKKQVDAGVKLFSLTSTICVLIIVGGMVASNSAAIIQNGVLLLTVVFIHNILGYFVGFGAAKLLKVPDEQISTMVFQDGLKNSSLAGSIAANQFTTPDMAIASAPGAIATAVHQITAALLANFLASKYGKKE